MWVLNEMIEVKKIIDDGMALEIILINKLEKERSDNMNVYLPKFRVNHRMVF